MGRRFLHPATWVSHPQAPPQHRPRDQPHHEYMGQAEVGSSSSSRCACSASGRWEFCLVHKMPAELCKAAEEEEDRQVQLDGLQGPLGELPPGDDDAGGLGGWEEEGAAAAASRVEAEQRSAEETARVEAARSDRARKLWRAAALAEGQQLRVEALRKRQAKDAASAERKREISAQIERELDQELGGKAFEAVLAHFGATSVKKLLVEYHPDKAPAGASFEKAVRREVIFKYVQQRRDQSGVVAGGGSSGSDEDRPPGERPKSEEQAKARRRREYAAAEAWRARQAADARERARRHKQAAAEEAERQRNAVPQTAVLRVENAFTGWTGAGHATALGPFGFYEIDPRGEINAKAAYRKIPWVRILRFSVDFRPFSGRFPTNFGLS